MKVCIDPGHGGRDPGAVSGKLREADVALRTALVLEAVLEARGHQVVMTRTKDEDLAPPSAVWNAKPPARSGKSIDLSERSRISNRFEADAFVSLHCNAAAADKANGAWVLHDDESLVRGKALAEAVFTELAKIPGVVDADAEREVFPDDSPATGGRDLAVLGRATNAPAILVEMGFLTNPGDRAQMLIDDDVIAAAIATGLEVWRGR